ncbi:hypothetical protein ABZ454_35550 [Streptomyces sp. NPDC005803]|uniref:hypothetical protein n=1 Tax=Streptomyces sp. NPDC005803 TaxID=3154297 RepID=UPI0033F76A38
MGDVVVQAAGVLAAAQRFQQVPARFGQDVAPGELLAHGEDDHGDVDVGERHVHGGIHPRPDRRSGCPAPVQEAVDELLAEAEDRGGAPPCEQLRERLRLLLRGPGLLRRPPAQAVTAAL